MNVIFDNHAHLSPRGKNIEEVKRFEKAGGTHMMLVTLPRERGQTVEQQYESTLEIAKQAMEQTRVKILIALGPHPVELTHLIRDGKKSIPEAKNELLHSIDVAVTYIRNGKAIALGEVGRPHFPVSSEIIDASNDILLYAFQSARDAGCAIQLHTESGTPEVCKQLANIADHANFPKEKTVKHYSTPIINMSENHGLFPSVLAGKEALEKAFSQGTRFMMETDFLDDLKRPGAVLDITTVPKRARWLLETGIASETKLLDVFQTNPSKIYGIDFDR